MARSPSSGGNRSVDIGGNVTGSTIVTGDHNVAQTTYPHVTLPPAESVDISIALNALREVLAQLHSPDGRKIDNALRDAKDELAKTEPDKDAVGRALERALDYASKADKFAEVIEKLAPHLKKAAAWLGENWYKILGVVGLTV